MIDIIFEFITEHPASMLIAGGILSLILSGVGLGGVFATWGWILIILGVILQLIWLFLN